MAEHVTYHGEITKNVVYFDQFMKLWVVESADGSWDGYELYNTEEEAIEAAQEM